MNKCLFMMGQYSIFFILVWQKREVVFPFSLCMVFYLGNMLSLIYVYMSPHCLWKSDQLNVNFALYFFFLRFHISTILLKRKRCVLNYISILKWIWMTVFLLAICILLTCDNKFRLLRVTKKNIYLKKTIGDRRGRKEK